MSSTFKSIRRNNYCFLLISVKLTSIGEFPTEKKKVMNAARSHRVQAINKLVKKTPTSKPIRYQLDDLYISVKMF